MADAPTQEGMAPFRIHSIGTTSQTHYKVFGDLQSGQQPPLVLLHGGPGSGHEYLLPFAQLWSLYGIPIVLYDEIGCAGSTHFREKAGDESFWTADLFVAELENLLAHLQLDRAERGFDLLGHSWGGVVAATFAARRPRELRRLVLVGPPSTGQLFVKEVWRLAEQLSTEAQTAIKDAVQKREFASPAYLAAMDEFFRTFMCRASPVPPELTMRFKHQADDPTVRSSLVGPSIFLEDGTLTKINLIPLLPHINVPTMLLNGEFDTAQYQASLPFFQHIPRIRWVTIANASHMLHLDSAENRQKVLRLVGDFVQPEDPPSLRPTESAGPI